MTPPLRNPHSAQQPSAEGSARSDGISGPWLGVVATSVILPGGIALAGGPLWVTITVGLAVALAGLGELLADLARRRGRRVQGVLSEALAAEALVAADERFAERTHGHLSKAIELLGNASARLEADASAASALKRTSVKEALDAIRAYEEGLKLTAAKRGLRRRRGPAASVGGLVLRDDADESGRLEAMRPFGDELALPGWIRHEGTRELLARLGDILDDVRRLHSAAIEWAVLLFTLWMRLLIVAAAPLCGSLTFGVAPAEGGFTWRDLPWAAVVTQSAITAALAPIIASGVMRRDKRGEAVRLLLLAIEIPLALVVLLTAPSWLTAAFAAGWINWWQRPDFRWFRLGLWVAAVAGGLAVGLSTSGAGIGPTVAEIAASMVVIFLVGDSYGAMLPVSAGVMLRVVVGGVIAPFKGKRRSSQQLTEVVEMLRGTAVALDAGEVPDEIRNAEAVKLRAITQDLAEGVEYRGRLSLRQPRRIGPLVDDALRRFGPWEGSARATQLAASARLLGEEPPLTVVRLTFYCDELRAVRPPTRKAAGALSQFVVEVVREAERHGTGALQAQCRHRDGRVVIRFFNTKRRSPATDGRTSGRKRLEELAEQFGGMLEVRGEVNGRAVDLPERASFYLVEVSFPWPEERLARHP